MLWPSHAEMISASLVEPDGEATNSTPLLTQDDGSGHQDGGSGHQDGGSGHQDGGSGHQDGGCGHKDGGSGQEDGGWGQKNNKLTNIIYVIDKHGNNDDKVTLYDNNLRHNDRKTVLYYKHCADTACVPPMPQQPPTVTDVAPIPSV